MFKKVVLILISLLMCLSLPVVFAHETSINEQDSELQKFLDGLLQNVIYELAVEQLIYEQCRNDYPNPMQQRYGDEENVFNALAKTGQDDERRKWVIKAIFDEKQAEFDAEKQQLKTDSTMHEITKNPNLCDDLLMQVIGKDATLDKIIYDSKTFNFYFNIDKKWFVGQIAGYGLTPCDCDNDNLPEQQKERKDLIENAKQLSPYVEYFFMSHNDGEEEAYIHPYIPPEQASLYDDLGWEFIDIKPIDRLPSNVSFKSLFKFKEQDNLTYRCQINYIDPSQSSCFEGMIK